MSDSDQLRATASRYAEKYGFKSDSLERGLEAYAVHLFAQEDGFDEVLGGEDSEAVDLGELILRSDDLGVDGVLEDEVNKRLLLVQATWRTKAEAVEEKLNSFSGVVQRLLNPEYLAKGGEAARELLGALSEQLQDGYSVDLRFVTNLRIGDKERLLAAVDAANRAFEMSGDPITLEIFGAAELLRRDSELHSAKSGAAVESISFKVQADHALTLNAPSQAPRKTLVAVLKGSELAALFLRRDVGNRLFTANIRLPLTTKKVNPAIAETARKRGEDFFYFNNGVSAVCSEFQINESTVTAKRFQVINGAQTISALAKALGRAESNDVYVLFRLTETAEPYGGGFTEDVIRYNNTQNPVKVSDFFSNDAIQVWLSEHLSAKSGKGPMPTFYYVHKPGLRPGKARGRKQLKIDVLAGIRHAFLYGPTISYREPTTFFDRTQRYDEAFGIQGKPVHAWDEEALAEACCAIAINDRVQAVARDLKKNPATKELDEAKYLYRLSRYVTGLVAEGLRAIMPDKVSDYRSLVASEATFKKYIDPLVNHARTLVDFEMAGLKGTSIQPEYNFARDDKAWEKLATQMKSAALTRLTF